MIALAQKGINIGESLEIATIYAYRNACHRLQNGTMRFYARSAPPHTLFTAPICRLCEQNDRLCNTAVTASQKAGSIKLAAKSRVRHGAMQRGTAAGNRKKTAQPGGADRAGSAKQVLATPSARENPWNLKIFRSLKRRRCCPADPNGIRAATIAPTFPASS